LQGELPRYKLQIERYKGAGLVAYGAYNEIGPNIRGTDRDITLPYSYGKYNTLIESATQQPSEINGFREEAPSSSFTLEPCCVPDGATEVWISLYEPDDMGFGGEPAHRFFATEAEAEADARAGFEVLRSEIASYHEEEEERLPVDSLLVDPWLPAVPGKRRSLYCGVDEPRFKTCEGLGKHGHFVGLVTSCDAGSFGDGMTPGYHDEIFWVERCPVDRSCGKAKHLASKGRGAAGSKAKKTQG
jgi:hypothetical protein